MLLRPSGIMCGLRTSCAVLTNLPTESSPYSKQKTALRPDTPLGLETKRAKTFLRLIANRTGVGTKGTQQQGKHGIYSIFQLPQTVRLLIGAYSAPHASTYCLLSESKVEFEFVQICSLNLTINFPGTKIFQFINAKMSQFRIFHF